MNGDLYQALDVGRAVSAQELRDAFDRIRRAFPPTSQADLAAAQAYAVLGDPRLRAEYDAGRVVGSGAGLYYELPTSSVPGAANEHSAVKAGSSSVTHVIAKLEARWQRRISARLRPAVTGPRRPASRWPAFLAGNLSGAILAVACIRLALGHPIGQ